MHNARADAFADAGQPLRRTTCQKPQKKAADAFSGVWEYKVIQSNPPCGCPMGCGTLYGREGFFLAFAAVPSGMSSRWGVLFFPLAAAMPFSKLRLATRCVPSRGSCYVLRSQKGRVLPHVRLPRVHFQSGVSFTTLALPRCAPPHVPATRAFPWEPSPIMGGSFQTCACHALTAHQGRVVPRLGLAACACHALLAPSCVSFQTTLALPGYEAPLRVVFSEPAPATLTPSWGWSSTSWPSIWGSFFQVCACTRWLPHPGCFLRKLACACHAACHRVEFLCGGWPFPPTGFTIRLHKPCKEGKHRKLNTIELNRSTQITWRVVAHQWASHRASPRHVSLQITIGRAGPPKPKWNKVGQRTQKQDGAQHAFLKKSCGVGSCALHEIDVRSLLTHRSHWWYQGPQLTTACCASYVYILLAAWGLENQNEIKKYMPWSLLFFWFVFVWFLVFIGLIVAILSRKRTSMIHVMLFRLYHIQVFLSDRYKLPHQTDVRAASGHGVSPLFLQPQVLEHVLADLALLRCHPGNGWPQHWQPAPNTSFDIGVSHTPTWKENPFCAADLELPSCPLNQIDGFPHKHV